MMNAVLRATRPWGHWLKALGLGLLLGLGLTGGARAQPAAAEVAAQDLYRIGPGDALKITVYQSPDLSVDTKVTEAGVISYPLLGSVKLGGLTVTQAEAAIADALKKGEFVKNPQVIIVVTQVRANQVNVLGQVGSPGRFPLDLAGMRLTEVLALAGGVAQATGSETVVLVGNRNGKPFRQEIDLPSIFAENGRGNDVVVQPGDVVWVDRGPQIYLYGEVQRPGQIRLERNMTVMQALAVAGGLTQRGTLRGLRINRRDAGGRFVTLEPAMEDRLREGDVVYIRESLF
jgi:polysaccharide biosynthesis/export protein